MPKIVYLENGQAAVLALTNGFAAIVPIGTDWKSMSYSVYFSESGKFDANAEPMIHDSAGVSTELDIRGSKVQLVVNGVASTYVKLATDDNTTRIAAFPETNIANINVSALSFKTNVALTPEKFEDFARRKFGR